MNRSAGFTLVELIVVLAIMGLVGSLALLRAGPPPSSSARGDSVHDIGRQAVRTGRAIRLGQAHDLSAVLALPDGRLLRDSDDVGGLDAR